MRWFFGGVVLLIVAVLLRRLLYQRGGSKGAAGERAVPRSDLEAIYLPLAQEIEAHTTILGITLNDAFSEREAGRRDMAWHVVRLALGEWTHLMEFIIGMQGIMGKYLPNTNGIVSPRRIAASHFKSRVAIDYVGFYEFLDQVLFSSKQRFSLQLRLMFRAGAMLTKQLRQTCREGERTLDCSKELWSRLDYFFHDFDLIAKETLLALHTLLVCQSPDALQDLTQDLQALLERGMRVSIPPSNP